MPDFGSIQTRGYSSRSLDLSSEVLFRERLIEMARMLGTPVPTRNGGAVFDELSPVMASSAKPRSLSRIFSDGEFPLHNDTAHWLTPCRYIILACLCPGDANRPTLILDTARLSLNSSQRGLLHSAPLRITNGRNSFFSTILSKSRQFVRYDPGCMAATTLDGVESLAVLSRHKWQNDVENFHWKPGKVLIIDNWRILHGRGQACAPDQNRKLLRITIR